MMKKISKWTGIVLITLFGLNMAVSGLYAAEKEDEAAKAKKAAQEKKREMIQEAKDSFNNTDWAIKLIPTGEDRESRKEEEDILHFSGYKFRSDKLINETFKPTNYTVRLKGKDGSRVIWETMQTSESKGVAFWRGEFQKDGSVQGVLSWHVSDEDRRDFSFSGEKTVIVEEVLDEVSAQDTEELITESVEAGGTDIPEVVTTEAEAEAAIEVEETPAPKEVEKKKPASREKRGRRKY